MTCGLISQLDLKPYLNAVHVPDDWDSWLALVASCSLDSGSLGLVLPC